MANIVIRREACLDAAGRPEFMRGTLYAAENQAHRFVISAVRDGQAVALGGEVTALFGRPDQETVYMTGEIEGGCACVTLPQSCYIHTGRFQLTVFVAESGVKTAVYCLAGDVRMTSTQAISDPGHVIPDIGDIAVEYAAMKAPVVHSPTLEDIYAADAESRRRVLEYFKL